ncbi:methyltransferase [Buchnera aphidicola]|uniref:Methyltransferase domain-containing protein n=1 Tax=Buchnera aphidicola (Anoecia oenotherae) TaxID=1241833 RepID=A0A4D6Y4N7_9GAMM|nr:methyltransferase [Buchnera aphidicola]QCI19385.1 methyltransferase domain-containing protein [Buchnera aphidicola (Anoecia oenotherae)]
MGKIKKYNKKKIFFGVFIPENFSKICNTIVYFWPKNKQEAIFQMKYLFSIFSISTEVFIIGKNRSGVKSAENMLEEWINLKKIQGKDRCTLFYGKIKKKYIFILNNFIKSYFWNKIHISCLPGVFGYSGIDSGTLLLLSTLDFKIYGDILDIGCGSGIISIQILKLLNKNNITVNLLDECALSLYSSKLNIENNNLKASVFESNIFSRIDQKFNLIISNPPIHNDLKQDFFVLKNIIKQSKNFLKKNGELRIVINSSCSFEKYFKRHFKKIIILKKNKNYKVYQGLK